MAQVIGAPGSGTARRGALFVGGPLVLLFLFVFVPATYAVAHYAERWGLLGVVTALACVAISGAWRRKDVREVIACVREGRQWLKGAEGERLVGAELAKLSDEYIVFHDFHPVDPKGTRVRWNVDHIVLGPTGIFVIDAKHYSHTSVRTAASSRWMRKNVGQVQRNAMDLKNGLIRWSNGDLQRVFVVPIVVYTQEGTRLERLAERNVRTLPLRLLVREITSHTETAIDLDRAGRIARVLFSQLSVDDQAEYRGAIDAYGRLAKTARYAARHQRRMAREAEREQPSSAPAAGRCPKCGGALVERVARRGQHAGSRFFGCENFPITGCRYTVEVC